MALGNLVPRPDDAPLYISRSTGRLYPGVPGTGGTGDGENEVYIGASDPIALYPGTEIWIDTDAEVTAAGRGYEHVQGVADDIWVIDHNLGYHPNVTVIDSGGSEVEGAISYPDADTMVLTFSAGFSGKAYLS